MSAAIHSRMKVDPAGLLAGIMLSFLATAGLFYVNIMAAIVDGLITGLGISESKAGLIGSANIYGASVGALIAVAALASAVSGGHEIVYCMRDACANEQA